MILAILQARMSSKRLPEKVLQKILNKPILQLEIERLVKSKRIDKLVVATSNSPEDAQIEKLCNSMGVDCFKGSLDDVLDRFYHAAERYNPDHIIRLTGDCPLHDSGIIDTIADFYLAGKYDFVCNTIEATFPDGLDTWIFSFSALEHAWKEAKKPSEREHVCTFMIHHPELFKTGNFRNDVDLSSMRWTVDEPADFNFVKAIYEELYEKNPDFNTRDVLALLNRKPFLQKINTGIGRDEGLQKSLLIDRQAEIARKGLLIPNSLAMQEKAKRRIPGMTQLLSKRVDQFSDGVWPGYYSKAKGVDVWDLDGNQYIDMSIGGIGATVLGYADDEVDHAVFEALRKGVSCSLNCAEEVELAEILCTIHPWADKARFTRSGGEAMSVAVRIARAFSGRDLIAFCGYHGWHDWYLSANLGAMNNLDGHLLPGLDTAGVPRHLAGTMLPFRYNQLEELQKIVKENGSRLGAIVMEPIRNDDPVPGFLEGVRTIADQTGAVLIIDEITAAFRMNSGGAHLLYGLEPDIAVFAKAIGNGYPMGAIIGRKNIMDAAQKSFISSTNWTERIGPTAALATINKFIKMDASKHLMECGKQVQEGWAKAAQKTGLSIHVGGIYPLSHFNFEKEHLTAKAYFIQLMLEKGFLASNLFYSMYAHRPWHIEAYLNAVENAFEKIAMSHSDGTLEKRLKGKPASSGFKRLN